MANLTLLVAVLLVLPAALLAGPAASDAAPQRKPPLIVTQDADIDDRMALQYLLHTDAFDLRAVVVNQNAFVDPIYGMSETLTTLSLAGCPDNIPVSLGHDKSMIRWGSGPDGKGDFLASILPGIDHLYSCVNVSDSFRSVVPASPYTGARIIIKALKGAEIPAAVLILGSWTDLALAVDLDPSIIPKIGTVYISGGQYNYTGPFSVNTSWVFKTKNKGSGWNLFVDPFAVNMVLRSGIKNFVAMPSSTQYLLPTTISTSDAVIAALGVTNSLPPYLYDMFVNGAPCLNQTVADISWWDESAAAMAVQIEKKVAKPFCTAWQTLNVSIHTADGNRFGLLYPDAQYGVPVKTCIAVNETLFLREYWGAVGGPAVCPKGHKSTRPGFYGRARMMLEGVVKAGLGSNLKARKALKARK